MLGKPRFKREDLVTFNFNIEGEIQKIDGVIYIVDANGTFEQNEEPSYDNEEPSYDIEAVYRGEVTLFKHVRESEVSERGM